MGAKAAAASSGLTPAAASALSALTGGSTDLFGAAYTADNGVSTTDPANARRDEEDAQVGADDFSDDTTLSADQMVDEDADPGVEADDSDESDAEPSDEEESGEAEESAQDVEEIDITDERGRRKFKINYADRDATKKAYQLAAGARKYRHERDAANRAIAERDKAAAPLKEKAESMDKLNEAWGDGGVAGLARLVGALSKDPKAFDQIVDAVNDQRKTLAAMSPAERAAHDRAEAEARKAEEANRSKKEYEERLKQLDEKAESAERATFQSYMEDSFGKFRFAGKLGDAALEHELDETMWDSVKARLGALPEDAEITPLLIAQTFERKQKALRKTIEQGVRKETKQVMTQKKVEAKTQAQAQMKSSGKRTSTKEQEARNQIRSGDMLGGIMKLLGGSKK